MKEKIILNDRNNAKERIGRFRISDILIEKAPGEIMQLMSNMIITRAEHRFFSRQMEYEAFSPLFRENGVCENIPFYEIIATVDPDGNITFSANESEEVKGYASQDGMRAILNKPIAGVKEVYFKKPEEK
jgi:hypothetical protein